MQTLQEEAKLLVVDAQEILDSFDKEISLARKKHLIAILCRNYARLYAKLNEKERE